MKLVDKAILRADDKARDLRWQSVGTARAYRVPLLAAAWLILIVPAMATFGARWGWSFTNATTLALAGWLWFLSEREQDRRSRLRVALRWAKAGGASNAYPKVTSDHFRPRLPSLARIQTSHGGNVHADIVIPAGMTYNSPGTTQLEKLVPLIVGHLQPRPLSYQLAPTPDLGTAKLSLIYWRAFGPDSPPIPYVPGAGAFVTEAGAVVHIDFPGEHTLVVAQTGGGKSGVLNVTIAEALAHEHRPQLWGIDLKRTELSPWAGVFARLALTPEDAVTPLWDLSAEQDRRQKAMAAAGIRVWEPGCGFPPLLVVVDELNEVVRQSYGDEDGKAPAVRRNRLASIARLGRATGVQVIAATQDPKADVIEGIKPNMQTTIVGHVRAENDAVTALGPGLAAELRPETLEAPNLWIVPAKGRHYAARAKWLDDATVTQIAAAHTRQP